MGEPSLLQELQDGVLTLSLNRPSKLNAVDTTMACALLDAIVAADTDTAVRVVLLRGNGRAFCAGRDVSAAPTDADLESVQAVATAIVRCSRPVVAAVHGWVLGAGIEWMLDADVAVAASSTRFKLPEASLGVFVTGGVTATLPAMSGIARAKALMLLGDEFSATQAQAWGLLWAVVADAELEPHARRMALRLASVEPAVLQRYKRVLNGIGLAAFDRAIGLESAMQRELMPPRA